MEEGIYMSKTENGLISRMLEERRLRPQYEMRQKTEIGKRKDEKEEENSKASMHVKRNPESLVMTKVQINKQFLLLESIRPGKLESWIVLNVSGVEASLAGGIGGGEQLCHRTCRHQFVK